MQRWSSGEFGRAREGFRPYSKVKCLRHRSTGCTGIRLVLYIFANLSGLYAKIIAARSIASVVVYAKPGYRNIIKLSSNLTRSWSTSLLPVVFFSPWWTVVGRKIKRRKEGGEKRQITIARSLPAKTNKIRRKRKGAVVFPSAIRKPTSRAQIGSTSKRRYRLPPFPFLSATRRTQVWVSGAVRREFMRTGTAAMRPTYFQPTNFRPDNLFTLATSLSSASWFILARHNNRYFLANSYLSAFQRKYYIA